MQVGNNVPAVFKKYLWVLRDLCGERNCSRQDAKCAKKKNDFKFIVLRKSFHNPIYLCVFCVFARERFHAKAPSAPREKRKTKFGFCKESLEVLYPKINFAFFASLREEMPL